ncbi:hypothetical protein H696_03899 [Fonticula alba]|uniref:DNA-directed RNA polymerases I and III subunit RPAC2 n=1 Tax=Fonticula alba TaxID=691883 RepID=A0A058Z5G1_FONAL|nr:hypothetical protein H696_03899 [Fonticula alba]KCV69470.1 hypothetical protein H696_03899 [Fonticula alba]|eukprot:XP_009496035.1 hypothetical protein H696_03899 [Fonticula alba]
MSCGVTVPYYSEPAVKISILPEVDSNPAAATFVLFNEDHTLGNSLRHLLMRNPRVVYCGYSAPHPTEEKIHLRIQTEEGYTAVEALQKSLDDLVSVCDHMLDTFTESVTEFATAIEASEGTADQMQE